MRKLIKKALAPLVRELVQERLKEIEAENKKITELELQKSIYQAIERACRLAVILG